MTRQEFIYTEDAALEEDPTGKAAHEPGAKLDANKPRVGLMFQGFALALQEVAKVTTYGAQKYSPGGWQHVPDGVDRYSDAMGHHILKEVTEGEFDVDSGLTHAAQIAWNTLARLELMLRGK